MPLRASHPACQYDCGLDHHVLICLLGGFRLLKQGLPVPNAGAKGEAFLATLALQDDYRIHRDTLLPLLWPETEALLAGQSLNSLVYKLRKLLGVGREGGALLLQMDGYYQLNATAGVAVDVMSFERLLEQGNRQAASDNYAGAAEYFWRAADLYRGDLFIARDVHDAHAIAQREALRSRYVDMLSQLAEHYYLHGLYSETVEAAQHLLATDPFREDIHRLLMRCHVLRGQRSQALHQYRVCEELLQTAFGAAPEAGTTELFDQVRFCPTSILPPLSPLSPLSPLPPLPPLPPLSSLPPLPDPPDPPHLPSSSSDHFVATTSASTTPFVSRSTLLTSSPHSALRLMPSERSGRPRHPSRTSPDEKSLENQ